MEVEDVVASTAAKETVWLKKFLMELRVISLVIQPIILFCDNSGVVM